MILSQRRFMGIDVGLAIPHFGYFICTQEILECAHRHGWPAEEALNKLTVLMDRHMFN